MAHQNIKHPVPVLPSDSVISYLNEGAANIVYRVGIKYPTPPPSQLEEYGDGTPPPTELEFVDRNPHLAVFDDKLLRVRKNLPTTAPCAVAQASWEKLIQPMFNPHEIVEQTLVDLRQGNIINRLNEELRGWERQYPLKGSLRSLDARPTQRYGIFLADDDFGLLVTDMTPTRSNEVIEFKPKWLVQSPSAPRDSKRCRTCALHARINAEKIRKEEPLKKTFCPLDLVSDSPHDILHVTQLMLSPKPKPENIARSARWLQKTNLLRRLRHSQFSMDRVGVIDGDVNDQDFLVAMTLRDCTVFVRFPEDPEMDDQIEARIGDLDLKSKDKAEYWKSIEQPLIDEGWYTGTEKEEDWQPLQCSLSQERWGPAKGMRGKTSTITEKRY